MWVEEITLENIKCFSKVTIRLSESSVKCKWVTLLSENGSGKSTVLQALALALAGPEAASQLMPRPVGWLRDEHLPGKISVRIHKENCDAGQFGEGKIRNVFGYSMHVTGREKLTIGSKSYSEPGIHESPNQVLTWLRQNAFLPKNVGWFAVGYGAFRRLTRAHQVLVPTIDQPSRFANFRTQFFEDEGLATFERWMLYLDYRQSKTKDSSTARRIELAVAAINELLPAGIQYEKIDEDGRILFSVHGKIVPTSLLSDGYRSVLALAGDLVWRLMESFPASENPLHEAGVVLIDELDIHLHPLWQRLIPSWLQDQFPNIQFIVTTHSPMVAAGAGENAKTIKLDADSAVAVGITQSLFAMSVDEILQTEAFGMLSPFSPATQKKIERHLTLATSVKPLSAQESSEYEQLSLFLEQYNPLAITKLPNSLESRIADFLQEKIDAKA